jgi:hypothetical protein
MKMIKIINKRIKELHTEVTDIVNDQTLNLTQKNKIMQPLVEEKKVLEHTLIYLEKIKNTDYQGLCGGN